MAKKLETTAEGIICSCCGQDKPDYHFYSPRGITTKQARFFFVNPIRRGDVCWQCNGGYRCLGCGEIKDAGAFRVGGRFCYDCKNAGIYKVLAEANTFKSPVASVDTCDSENALESGVS